MRLSEAILLGSIGSEQGFGVMSGNPSSKAKCAIGAALFASGVSLDGVEASNAIGAVAKLWPWTYKQALMPGRNSSLYIFAIIWRLNDIERWSRPRIAAWVAEQEVLLGIVDQPTQEQVPCEVK